MDSVRAQIDFRLLAAGAVVLIVLLVIGSFLLGSFFAPLLGGEKYPVVPSNSGSPGSNSSGNQKPVSPSQPDSVNALCPDTDMIDSSAKRVVVGSVASSPMGRVSGKGIETPFLFVYKDSNLVESIQNSTKTEEDFVDLIVSKSPSVVVFDGISQNIINRLANKGISCIKVGGRIESKIK